VNFLLNRTTNTLRDTTQAEVKRKWIECAKLAFADREVYYSDLDF